MVYHSCENSKDCIVAGQLPISCLLSVMHKSPALLGWLGMVVSNDILVL